MLEKHQCLEQRLIPDARMHGGTLRFWEAHLTVPGQIDAYGVTLSGLPGLGIGFTKTFGWTHTVSAGNRFTAYRLSLVPGQPTKYRYGDQVRDLVPSEHAIEVLGDDGKVSTVTRTTWSSHYGPVLDFPGVGWTDQSTITYRDANIDNAAFAEQYLAFLKAKDLDEFIAAGKKINGVPLFNTIATSNDGRAYYADWSATPNLSPEAIAAYDASLASDPIVKIARWGALSAGSHALSTTDRLNHAAAGSVIDTDDASTLCDCYGALSRIRWSRRTAPSCWSP